MSEVLWNKLISNGLSGNFDFWEKKNMETVNSMGVESDPLSDLRTHHFGLATPLKLIY